MNVIILPRVLEYLDSLVFILFEKEYFGFLETSINYIDELIDDIQTTLPTRLHKPAPAYFDRYGKEMEYAGFRKNKHTTWYVFFETYEKNEEVFYLVRYIANNHTVAQYL
ncbi:MAG: hypothetical protein FWG84_04765 [Bacteroidales bacterium]|nr:hypothetical protein [Bacteroidales bacterium]